METQNKQIIRNLYENILNNNNLDALNGIIAPAYAFAGKKGPEAYRSVVEAVLTAFPDIRFTIEDIFAEGDKVAVRWTWTAIHTGYFRHIPPSNTTVKNEGNVIYQLKDGKVVNSWLQSDRLGTLIQIGLIPEELVSPKK